MVHFTKGENPISQQTVESVLTRAMSDAAFADSLFANPEKTLTGFDLTAEEIASLKGMSRAEFFNATPEERKSMLKVCQSRDPETGSCIDPNHNETLL